MRLDVASFSIVPIPERRAAGIRSLLRFLAHTLDYFLAMLAVEVGMMGRKDLKVTFRGKSANGAPILYVLRGVILKDYTKPFMTPEQPYYKKSLKPTSEPAKAGLPEDVRQRIHEHERETSREIRTVDAGAAKKGRQAKNSKV
jgi:hypothetical protein